MGTGSRALLSCRVWECQQFHNNRLSLSSSICFGSSNLLIPALWEFLKAWCYLESVLEVWLLPFLISRNLHCVDPAAPPLSDPVNNAV